MQYIAKKNRRLARKMYKLRNVSGYTQNLKSV